MLSNLTSAIITRDRVWSHHRQMATPQHCNRATGSCPGTAGAPWPKENRHENTATRTNLRHGYSAPVPLRRRAKRSNPNLSVCFRPRVIGSRFYYRHGTIPEIADCIRLSILSSKQSQPSPQSLRPFSLASKQDQSLSGWESSNNTIHHRSR